MPNRLNAHFLEVFRGELLENGNVDIILLKGRRIAFHANLGQPFGNLLRQDIPYFHNRRRKQFEATEPCWQMVLLEQDLLHTS